jgi:translation elongation factor EF-G
VPRIAFANKMDRDGASLTDTSLSMEKRLGVAPLHVQLPIGEGPSFAGVVDLVDMHVVRTSPAPRTSPLHRRHCYVPHTVVPLLIHSPPHCSFVGRRRRGK